MAPISRVSPRKPRVDRFLSRSSVSLCWTSGWSRMCSFAVIKKSSSEYRTVTDDVDGRRAVSTHAARELAARSPGAAFQNGCKREVLPAFTELAAHARRELVEQRDGERAPFDDNFGAHLVLLLEHSGVARHEHAGVDE